MWVVNTTPRPLYPRERSGNHCYEVGWATGPAWTGAENLAPTGIRSPDRPVRKESLYRLRCIRTGYSVLFNDAGNSLDSTLNEIRQCSIGETMLIGDSEKLPRQPCFSISLPKTNPAVTVQEF